ncbi:lipopolysaccharide biosynthesis protein [Desulfoluna spongiiphila]|uniref:Membrane protein involved in the export of O-antigen and teichoic acid n=1 Tax=Desulfoluna spongiiphila TaxID=419481 RepID=A0A1G5BZS0_9BACT|nr:lipopolysaccharide biosynthesis protein [Desulfoluna spongiiphila]SCX95540.1 Membrane protein involved in the export of O-antigen and teichoic acid [Desulfoluna spongiiphila]
MSLKNKVLHSLKWLTIGKFMGQVFTWAVTILVIRLLSPSDYGLMASAGIFVGFLQLISELGFGASIIQARDIEDSVIQQIFGFVICVGVVLFAMLFVSAPCIGLFFESGALVHVVRVLSFQFLVIPFLTIPKALIEKELLFKQKSMIDFSASIASGATTLGVALLGHGVWALVSGSYVLICVQMVGYLFVSPIRKRPVFRFRAIGAYASFSGYVTFEKIVWYTYTQFDVILIGKLLGQEVLGYYSVAMHLSSILLNKISPILSQVAFPAYAKIQNEFEKVSFYFLRTVKFSSLVVFPVFWGLSSIAPEVISICVGPRWGAVVEPFKLLCLVMPFRMLSVLLPPLLKGIGNPGYSLRNIMITFAVMMVSIYVGATRGGVLGVCYAWVVMYPACWLVVLILSLPLIQIRVGAYLRAISVPLSGSLLMYGVVSYSGFARGVHPYLSVALLIGIGALVYGVWLHLFDRTWFSDVFAMLKTT